MEKIVRGDITKGEMFKIMDNDLSKNIGLFGKDIFLEEYPNSKVVAPDFEVDLSTGHLLIKTNDASENEICCAMADLSQEILVKYDPGFYFRELVKSVELAPEVTVLSNGIFADSTLEKVVIPAHIEALFPFALCNSVIDEIIFEGDNISLENAKGLFSWCSPGKDGFINISCNETIEAALVHYAEKVTDESKDTLNILKINGKIMSSYSEEEIEKMEEKFIPYDFDFGNAEYSVEFFDPMFDPLYTEEDVFCYYENYVQEHGSKPFVVEGENFSFNSLTGHVTVTGDGLSEDEMVAAMMEANKKVNEEFPEREQKEIDIQKLTTSISFDASVTKCPPTAFAEYKNLKSVILPENIKHMGINSFVFAGGNNHSFEIVIMNPDFDFDRSPKAINKVGFPGSNFDETANVNIYFDKGEIAYEKLAWIMPILLTSHKDNINLRILPLASYNKESEMNKGDSYGK